MYPTWDISCCSLQCITANKQTSSYRLPAYRGTVGITCKLQLYAAEYNLSRTCKLTVIRSIVTSCWIYIPQDFPLFVIIFITLSTTANDGSTNTSSWGVWIRSEPIDGLFIKSASGWNTAATQTPVSPLRHCNCSHQEYDPGRKLKKLRKTGRRNKRK